MNNHYTNLKNIFIDGEIFDYISLDKSTIMYTKLVSALDKPLKLILFYGKPGTGKTFLLQKIYNDLNQKKHIVFFPRPFFDEKIFLQTLYEQIFQKPSPDFSHYNEFLLLLEKHITSPQDAIPVLIDEAQLYPTELIEKIRLMADSRLLKFLFTVHKTEQEDVLAKDYFQTRIWEAIEIDTASENEIKTYIEKKLLFHHVGDLHLFKTRHYTLIAKLTGGNFRTINKLMYKLFEILEYYDEHNPSVIKANALPLKYIEMAGISLGMLHA